MKVNRSILSVIAATAVSLSIALPAFAKPAVIAGQQPGSRVNVRSNPTTASYSPHYALVGDRIDVLNQTRGGDGYTWYYAKFNSGAEGWIRQDFVRLTNPQRAAFLNGGSTGARINVRSAPTIQAYSPHYGVDGDRITVINQTSGQDGYTWYYIKFPTRAEGWVRGDLVQFVN